MLKVRTCTGELKYILKKERKSHRRKRSLDTETELEICSSPKRQKIESESFLEEESYAPLSTNVSNIQPPLTEALQIIESEPDPEISNSKEIPKALDNFNPPVNISDEVPASPEFNQFINWDAEVLINPSSLYETGNKENSPISEISMSPLTIVEESKSKETIVEKEKELLQYEGVVQSLLEENEKLKKRLNIQEELFQLERILYQENSLNGSSRNSFEMISVASVTSNSLNEVLREMIQVNKSLLSYLQHLQSN